MSKSLLWILLKKKAKILKINSKYNPAEISSKFAQIVSRGDSMSEEKIVSKDIFDVEEKTMYEFSLDFLALWRIH